MAILTAEQIEQKKQQLKQLTEEAQQLKKELVEAGAWSLNEDALDKVAGGNNPGGWRPPTFKDKPIERDTDFLSPAP